MTDRKNSPWSASQARARIICYKLENRQWTSDCIVIVGEHGDTRPPFPPKQYYGRRWQSVEFEADQIKRAFPKPDISAQAWMLKNASRGQKRDSLVRDCRNATGCTKRAAEAAYNDLPDTQRRRRGKPPRNFE